MFISFLGFEDFRALYARAPPECSATSVEFKGRKWETEEGRGREKGIWRECTIVELSVSVSLFFSYLLLSRPLRILTSDSHFSPLIVIYVISRNVKKSSPSKSRFISVSFFFRIFKRMFATSIFFIVAFVLFFSPFFEENWVLTLFIMPQENKLSSLSTWTPNDKN